MARKPRTGAIALAIVTAALTAGLALEVLARAADHQVAPPPKPTGASTPPVVGWKDLETWTHEVGSEPDTEIGLGLVVTGPEGSVSVSFAVTRLRRSPGAPPADVMLTLIPGFEPNRVRWSNLSFRVTGRDKKQTTIDGSARLTTYPPGPFGPGDAPVNARARLTPGEFLQLADAQTVSVSALGISAPLRSDQVKALQAFADRAGLGKR